MIETRYEEYIGFEKGLPFTFYPELSISHHLRRQEANWHDNLEIQICVDGKGTVMLDDLILPFEKGDIVVINSTVLHYTDAPEEIKCRCLIVDTEFCRRIGIDPAQLHFEAMTESKKMTELFEMLTKVYSDNADICRVAKLNGLLIDILVELRERHTLSVSPHVTRKRAFETVKKAIRFIRDNHNKKITLDMISKNVFMDKYTLSQEFKKVTNQTMIEYLNYYRCKKAADHIADGMSVSEAALGCGFSNISYFTKAFKKHMGVLPSRYKSE